jgi:hypothetical protein
MLIAPTNSSAAWRSPSFVTCEPSRANSSREGRGQRAGAVSG